jgi:transcriptional regulator with XRE-family HTH domain
MRKVIGMSAKDFAEALKLDPASLSRWENNKQTLGGWAESQVRLATVAILAQRMPSLRPDMEKLFRMVPRKREEGEAWPLFEMHLEPQRAADVRRAAGESWAALQAA